MNFGESERLLILNERGPRGWKCNNNGKQDGDETGVDCGKACKLVGGRACGKFISMGVFLIMD